MFYLLVIALAIWFVLEHTATGRRLYATGFNPDAARLANVTHRSAALLLPRRVGAAGRRRRHRPRLDDRLRLADRGRPYLLPAFAAAFLGATQLEDGRFNAWGTIIAVLLLGTVTTGLGLASTPQWATSVFTGVVLIAALAVTSGRVGMPKRLRRRAAVAA